LLRPNHHRGFPRLAAEGAAALALRPRIRRVSAVQVACPVDLVSPSSRTLAAHLACPVATVSLGADPTMFKSAVAALVAVVVVTVLGSVPYSAQSPSPAGMADQFAHAWNTHDRAAFERLFTEDAHFIPTYDIVGEGRADVVAGIYMGHEEGTGPFRETTLTPSKVSVQQLSADAAVVHFNVS